MLTRHKYFKGCQKEGGKQVVHCSHREKTMDSKKLKMGFKKKWGKEICPQCYPAREQECGTPFPGEHW